LIQRHNSEEARRKATIALEFKVFTAEVAEKTKKQGEKKGAKYVSLASLVPWVSETNGREMNLAWSVRSLEL